jgi:hypothetical protein
MSNSCCLEKAAANGPACPESGSVGSAVDRQTVKALLTEHALRRLSAGEYRFCPDPGCEIVYFDAAGEKFVAADVRVPVMQKLPFGVRPVCYCFGESEESIRAEVETHGRSLAAERVREHIAAGRCACEVRNPRGVCCLGDVMAAVKRVLLADKGPSSAGPNVGSVGCSDVG